MRRGHPLQTVALAAVAFALAACRPPQLRFGAGGEIHDPRQLLALLEARGQRLRSLTAEGRITTQGPRGSGTTGVELAAQRPASLRLEVDGFFGSPVALLATDGRRMELFQVERGLFATGPATAENLGRLLPAPLPPELGVGLLLGDPPRLATGDLALRLDPARRAYALALRAGDRRQLLEVATETLDPVACRLSGPDGYEASFDDYRAEAGLDLPHRILLTVAAAAATTTVELTYRSVELNALLDPALFELAPPVGAKLVPLAP